MSKHTPGPWKHDRQYSLVGSNGVRVVSKGNGLSFGSASSWPDADANARLIAAAPDLLDALENAVSQMEMAAHCVENGRHDEALSHLNSLVSGKQAAIAKARGEA